MNDPGSDKLNTPASSKMAAWHFDQSIDSNPDNCAPLIEQILEQLERFEWTNKDVFAIHMSMEESILNAIRHGNRCSPEKRVRVRIDLDELTFYSQISDEGEGFCLEQVPDPTLEENLEKTSGRGVMLIRVFMDRVVYNEKGNSVELFKTKSAGKTSSEE
jgi:serine/threonine-protein kinase RsbW